MSTAIETLKAKQASAQDDYRALAEALITNEPVDQDKAQRVLHAAGKTPEQLEQTVARLKRIKELEEMIAGHDELNRQRMALDTERVEVVKKEWAEKEEMKKRHTLAESQHASRALKFQIEERKVRDAKQELHLLLHPQQEPTESAATPSVGGSSTEVQVGTGIRGGRLL